MNKMQQCEFNILVKIIELFEKNDVEYCLAYGSMLGAVRHKGFIPWDDDVDIYVKGKDYPRIRELFENTDLGSIKFHDYKTVKGYPYVFPKVVDTSTELKEKIHSHLDYTCGVYVDIFPVFEVSDKDFKFWLDNKKRYFHYGLVRFYYLKNSSNKLVAFFQKIIKKFINVNRVQKKLYKRYTSSKIKGSKVTEPNVFKRHRMIEKTYFDSYTKVKFEGVDVPIFTEYDKYLTFVYGDYMTPPPPEKQVGAHNIVYIKFDSENENE